MAVFSGNGSAASPSFTFSSDTNLGIYREGTDSLGIAANGAPVATFNSSTVTGSASFGGNSHYQGNISPDGTYSLTLAADGSPQIALGSALSGVYVVRCSGTNREQRTIIALTAHQFDSAYDINILDDYGYLGQFVMTNWRVVGNAGGSTRYLICDVSNRNGASVTISAVAIGNDPNIQLASSAAGSTALTSRPVVWKGARYGIGTSSPTFGLDIDAPATVAPFRASINSSEVAAIQSNGAMRVGVNAAPSGAGTGSLAIGGPLTIEATSSTYGSYAVYSEQVTDGSITASTGTIQFNIESVNAAVYLSCLVKVSVALRTNNTPGSTQPQCVYYFGLFRSNTGVVSVMSPTTVYENTFVRASHFAVSNPSTNVGRLTLTNPTASAQGGVYHVEIMSYGGLWQLQSVTTT